MKRAGDDSPGAMAAVLGLDSEAVAAACADATQRVGRPVILANDNCPGQSVISGDIAALDLAIELCKSAGARKVVKLAVSIAAHSPLMEPASAEFRKALDSIDIHEPQTPVYANLTTEPLNDKSAIRQRT